MIEKILIVCLLVGGWLVAAYLWCCLYAANDTIRLLRANAATVTAGEREAVNRAVATLNGGQQFDDETPLAGDAATLRGLLERLK